ncbi:hydantoinase/oxoprolinase family protein [Ketobacter sp. MCCC 1A13808]|uniref:hydantoinase/oxoprolinase family protein n=1 Tax=Ketobacter sp. MCCC 1A13808 TaxID=2602738 RepID=UPI000F2BBB97|nr:hydantoinase/oxoprolinase family protein [Ketobacter sp. MCCC 1A13808]MVF13501.1 hydantoinase/oxoprolinase family protein [Ketobacter sp. MCCC 1A13808]RLP52295.1 MAG: hydantoinase/oxoprolinase family protein [Ketobacter sp.]
MSYRVGIDIGGTFTDFALLKGDEVILHKNLSTPEDRSIGVMTGLEKLAQKESLTLSDFLAQCDAIVHGTTIADNTLIEMNGAVTGLITTNGFRDEMEYRRGFKEDIWDSTLKPFKQITPRRRRLTVPERILFDGSVYEELDEAAVREACRKLNKQNVESVAISLLFSFVNSAHELRVAEIVKEEMPNAHLSISHQVLPRGPEYDRTSTTVVNAYVGPRVTSYLEKLVSRLRDGGFQNQLLVMQASGGVMTKEYIDGSPIRVLASGPAGGVIGSAHTGSAKGAPNLLCVDMGGTSYDMSIVLNGTAPATSGWNMHHRYLIGMPMVQVETLGAGGGSICQINAGEVQVGPRSAGSDPGPMCYGRGGTEPTVTDALLMLGILSADGEFAGGSFSLQKTGVEDAFQVLGDEMGYSAEEAAFDCWRVVNANMIQAIRRTTAGKGIDPKEMVMLAYGGNGPAFAAVHADALGIEKVLVPKASPTFSALGTLVAKPTIDEERSCNCSVGSPDLDTMKTMWQQLEARALKYFADAKFSGDQIRYQFLVNMRYAGQNFAVSFEVHDCRGSQDYLFLNDGFGEKALQAFNKRHMQEFEHIREGELPEIIGVRLVSSVNTTAPAVGQGFNSAKQNAIPVKTRRANLGEGYQDTSIFEGAALQPGHEIQGPAIIEETFTTIVVYPGWNVMVDDSGDYEMRKIKTS